MSTEFNYPLAALAELERNPKGVTLTTPTEKMTNGQLARLIRLYAHHMALRGVTRNSTVVLALRNGPTGYIAAMAANLLGARWVGMFPNLPFAELRTTHFFHGSDRPRGLRHPGLYEIDASWAEEPVGLPFGAGAEPTGFQSASDIAYYTRSSGSTGAPKHMAKTAGQVSGFMNMPYMATSKGIAPLAPVLSSMTFRNITAAILYKTRVVLIDLRPDDKGAVLRLQKAGADFVIGSPTQIDALCRGTPPLKNRLGEARVGGAIMTHKAIAHWLNYFEALTLSYGSREGGGGGTLRLSDISEETVIAYTPRAGAEVEVVDEEGHPCPAGQAGILRFRSPNMVSGYIGAPEINAEVFRDGWFYPGDLGVIDADGRFRVLGRIKDQLNLGGIKFNAIDIDERAQAVDGVVDAMCFAAPNETGVAVLNLCVVAEAGYAAAELAAAIRESCARFNRSITITHIYLVPRLPINENGKHVRREGPDLVRGLLAV